ncbi:hypothetical protein UFOVP625_43 [uncultured Caudovirales phage]|uniref:Uncharacterized protein n=1 Tax=uncultured Caudovirales phage TaxID=2100421 RepID=A0A6J5N5C8_9CAUD|nr:hypothetical protein UFOVP625_43 [uncultured Caudovirales phage]
MTINDEQIVYPQTLLQMLLQAQMNIKQLEALLVIWRKIADDLVYTEHDEYDHYHRNPLSPCVRCVAHNAYHDQVNTEENP